MSEGHWADREGSRALGLFELVLDEAMKDLPKHAHPQRAAIRDGFRAVAVLVLSCMVKYLKETK